MCQLQIKLGLFIPNKLATFLNSSEYFAIKINPHKLDFWSNLWGPLQNPYCDGFSAFKS